MKQLGVFTIIMLLALLYIWYIRSESFWGGYFPTAYAGQYVPQFGRTGIDAATDAPRMFIDTNALPISGCRKH